MPGHAAPCVSSLPTPTRARAEETLPQPPADNPVLCRKLASPHRLLRCLFSAFRFVSDVHLSCGDAMQEALLRQIEKTVEDHGIRNEFFAENPAFSPSFPRQISRG